MDQLLQSDRNLAIGKLVTVGIKEPDVGDDAERVGHGHDAVSYLDPVPCHPCRPFRRGLAPKCLTAGR